MIGSRIKLLRWWGVALFLFCISACASLKQRAGVEGLYEQLCIAAILNTTPGRFESAAAESPATIKAPFEPISDKDKEELRRLRRYFLENEDALLYALDRFLRSPDSYRHSESIYFLFGLGEDDTLAVLNAIRVRKNAIKACLLDIAERLVKPKEETICIPPRWTQWAACCLVPALLRVSVEEFLPYALRLSYALPQIEARLLLEDIACKINEEHPYPSVAAKQVIATAASKFQICSDGGVKFGIATAIASILAAKASETTHQAEEEKDEAMLIEATSLKLGHDIVAHIASFSTDSGVREKVPLILLLYTRSTDYGRWCCLSALTKMVGALTEIAGKERTPHFPFPAGDETFKYPDRALSWFYEMISNHPGLFDFSLAQAVDSRVDAKFLTETLNRSLKPRKR